MSFTDFDFLRPATMRDAVEAIDDESLPIWGGTELLLAMRMGFVRPRALVDLRAVPELSQVSVEAQDELHIGAGLTHAQVARHPEVRSHAGIVSRTCGQVGNARVRAQGSLGGNVVFCEPKSDVVTVLSALGARLALMGSGGYREIAIEDFIVGPYVVDRQPDEVLQTIIIPLDSVPSESAYRKFHIGERPLVGVYAGRRDGRTTISVGAVFDRPIVLERDDVSLDSFLDALDEVPLGWEEQHSEDYRRSVCAALVRRCLDDIKETQ